MKDDTKPKPPPKVWVTTRSVDDVGYILDLEAEVERLRSVIRDAQNTLGRSLR